MPEEKEIICCALCCGTGHYNSGICPGCNGVGKFIDVGGWIYCSFCSGKGRVSRTMTDISRPPPKLGLGRTMRAWDRHAAGSITKYDVEVSCPVCHGAGKIIPEIFR